jgi:hypothetical protein
MKTNFGAQNLDVSFVKKKQKNKKKQKEEKKRK